LVTIKLFGNLRHPTVGKGLQLQVAAGATVHDILLQLFHHAPHLRDQIMEPGQIALRPHVNVMLKGRLVRDLQGLSTPVGDEDVIAVFPPSAGG